MYRPDDGRNILQVAQKFINIGMFRKEKVLPKSFRLKIRYKTSPLNTGYGNLFPRRLQQLCKYGQRKKEHTIMRNNIKNKLTKRTGH